MILYKYRQCSRTTDQIFKDQTVWLATPESLNDPCECSMHELAPDWVESRVHEMKAAQMSGTVMFSRSNPGLLKEIKQVLPPITDFDEKYKAFRLIYKRELGGRLSDPDEMFSQLQSQLAKVGVFSLASSPDNPLMWSHYAFQHEGICLGFEVRDLTPSSDSKRFLQVRYSDVIPKMSGQGFTQEVKSYLDDDGGFRNESTISFTDEAVRTAISTKATCWSYEGEWRYVEPLGGRTYPFPGPLVEMTFGLRCPREKRDHYIDLASKCLAEDVRLYEMQRVRNSFRFDRVFLGISPSKKDVSSVSIIAPAFAGEFDDTSIADTHPEIQRFIKHGQYTRALPLVEDALTADPNSAKLWRAKGVLLGRQSRHQDALECFERAIKNLPGFFSAWYHKGVALTQLERFSEAALAYEKAREIVPNDSSTIFNFAMVRYVLGQEDETRRLLMDARKCGHPRASEVLRVLDEPGT
ncbi:MAG: tetratricopeptide repeat protein [Janthinobacterium lividum]